MELRIGWKYIAAFFALNGVISELHEQAHMTTNRLLSGCYGPRDFNNVHACAGMEGFPLAASMAGPLFSYLVMWAGAWLLARAATPAGRAAGFSLIFAPLPFARVFTALMGGGDEKAFLTAMFDGVLPLQAPRWLAVALTLVFCAPPVYAAWRATVNKHRNWYIAAFCVLPLLVIGAYKLLFLNALLLHGVLAEPVFFGTPAFVLIVFALMLLATVWWRRWLLDLAPH